MLHKSNLRLLRNLYSDFFMMNNLGGWNCRAPPCPIVVLLLFYSAKLSGFPRVKRKGQRRRKNSSKKLFFTKILDSYNFAMWIGIGENFFQSRILLACFLHYSQYYDLLKIHLKSWPIHSMPADANINTPLGGSSCKFYGIKSNFMFFLWKWALVSLF